MGGWSDAGLAALGDDEDGTLGDEVGGDAARLAGDGVLGPAGGGATVAPNPVNGLLPGS